MKTITSILLSLVLVSTLFSKELIDINFENLKLNEFVVIVSKVLDKNILINEPLDGTINFSSNKKLSKDELFNILELSLQEKGYVLKEEKGFLKLVKIDDINNKPLVTKIINLKNIEGIGGLIENKNEQIEQKVPVLGDVPVVGNLFRNDANLNKKSNLVVIVTPYMIPKSKDITFVRNELAQLKNLEDKYLQDSLIRIKEDAIKKEEENKKIESKMRELDKKIASSKKVEEDYNKSKNIEIREKEIFDNLNPQ